jgi:predicted NACHT family NTPase
MNHIIKKVSVSLMALVLVVLTASAEDNATKSTKTSGFNWNPVMDAIIQVESEGNPKAVSGNSVGAMQITPILVKDCNEILKKQKSKKRYTMADRYSVAKSKEMFLLIQSYYNPGNSIEKAIRSWNGGVKYSVRATNKYYKKVMAMMK